jgi:purine-nucleoside phosphorylase
MAQKSNIMLEEAQVAANYLRSKIQGELPTLAIILGSGLGNFTNIVKVLISINYADIPSFPSNTVSGHKGRLSLVELDNGKQALVMEGRFHFYEGFSPQVVAFPITVFHLLGVKKLIVTNASGGLNPEFMVGDLMLINDHINFTGNHPLVGHNDNNYGPRFLDQTEPYCPELIALAKQQASTLEIVPQEGVYIGVSGPTYETRAEIRAFHTLGADAVGMSTIYEVIMANYFGIKVLGIACITNMATGLTTVKHKHEDVVKEANLVSVKFSHWVKLIAMQL